MTSERRPGPSPNRWEPTRIDANEIESRLERVLGDVFGQHGYWDVRVFEINAGSQIRVSTRVFDTGVDVMFDVRSLVGQREPTSFLVGEVVSHVDTMIARLDVPGPSITAPRTKLSMYAHYRGYDYNNTPQPQVRVAPFPQDPNNQLLMAKLLELYLEERVVIDCQEIRIGSGIGEMVFTSPVALRAYLEDVALRRQPALPVPQVTTSHVRRVEL